MHFETKKVEMMLRDLAIKVDKNMERIASDPNRKPYGGPELILELLYCNPQGQYLRTTILSEIGSLGIIERSDEGKPLVGSKQSCWSVEDQEEFRLRLLNPIFGDIEFQKIPDEEASAFIERYRALV
jgi:hypothetical protein